MHLFSGETEAVLPDGDSVPVPGATPAKESEVPCREVPVGRDGCRFFYICSDGLWRQTPRGNGPREFRARVSVPHASSLAPAGAELFFEDGCIHGFAEQEPLGAFAAHGTKCV